MVEILRMVTVALMGAAGAMAANRGIAVFHDGLRPLMPEFFEGRMKRRELASISFAISFGLVVGFGIPFSLMYPILLIHCLWLGTDIIGTWLPGSVVFVPSGSTTKGSWKEAFKFWKLDQISLVGLSASGVIGALYGMGLLIGLSWVVEAFKMLPLNFLPALGKVADPIIFAFAAFPCLAVAYEYGTKHGFITAFVTIATRQIWEMVLKLPKPDGIALAAGMICLILYAMFMEKRTKTEEKAATIPTGIFTVRTARIRRNIPLLAVLGALYGLAHNMWWVSEGPLTLTLLGEGELSAAIPVAIGRAIAFTPLKAMTSIASGCFVTDSLGWVAVAALASPAIPVIAAVVGAIVMTIEILALDGIARFLDLFPGVRKAADHIRTSMVRLLEVALLVGGMMAANGIVPGLGFLVIAAAYLLNEHAGCPINRMAVGPAAAIIFGLIANVLYVIGLVPPIE